MTIVPMSKRDYKRFGVEYFIAQDRSVYVLNVRKLIYKGIVVNDNIDEEITGIKYYEICNFRELHDILEKINDTESILINMFGDGSRSFELSKEISKYGFIYGALYVNTIPSPISKNKGIIESFISKYQEFTSLYTKKILVKKILLFFLFKIKKTYTQLKKYDFIVVSGSESLLQIQNVSNNTKIIDGHTMDMDILLQDQEPKSIEKKYIVYLDEYLPYHSDFELIGVNTNINIDKYYQKMNNFLDFLSKKYEKEIIICAHPRSNYLDKKVWQDKTLVYGKTYEYVKKSFLCLTHASTSTNFAVMLNKPIVFIYLNEITFYKNWIYAFSKSLNKKVVNIDYDNFQNINFTNIDCNKYENYLHKYISRNLNDHRILWEKVLNELERK